MTSTSSMMNSKKRSRATATSSVTFAPTITVQPIDKLATTIEEKANLYYSKADMATFNQEVKAIRSIVKKQAQHLITTTGDNASSASTSATATGGIILSPQRLEADPALRGLELHLLSTRVKNKILAQKALLKYQKGLAASCNNSHSTSKSDEESAQCLAAASQRLTAWSTQVALETARFDSLQAFDEEEYNIPLCECSVAISRFPILAKQSIKRRVTCDEHNHNNEEEGSGGCGSPIMKRQRMC